MGFLSKSAANAFKKGRRRAHVPDWFEPASYIFGALAVGSLVLLVMFSGNSTVSYNVAPNSTNSTTGSSDSSTTPSSNSIPTGDIQQVALTNGSVVAVSGGAYVEAVAASLALFTGNFLEVTIYPGQSTPTLTTIWPTPDVVGVQAIETFPDGSYRFSIVIDPDGIGTELARPIGVLIVPVTDGWAYLPG